jgi:hypothetical protein
MASFDQQRASPLGSIKMGFEEENLIFDPWKISEYELAHQYPYGNL